MLGWPYAVYFAPKTNPFLPLITLAVLAAPMGDSSAATMVQLQLSHTSLNKEEVPKLLVSLFLVAAEPEEHPTTSAQPPLLILGQNQPYLFISLVADSSFHYQPHSHLHPSLFPKTFPKSLSPVPWDGGSTLGAHFGMLMGRTPVVHGHHHGGLWSCIPSSPPQC